MSEKTAIACSICKRDFTNLPNLVDDKDRCYNCAERYMEREVICPYCDDVQDSSELYDYDDDELMCENCEKYFYLTTDVVVYYTTKMKD